MSSHCPWNGYPLHRYSNDTDCYMQHLYDNTYLHIFKNIPYSTDPKSGKPLTNTLVGVDDVKLLEFGLNHRVCNVESTINEIDVHVLDFRPNNATELWTLMRNVYNKWERLYENNGHKYWPCRSQAVDLLIDGSVDSLRCLHPTRFVTEKCKMTRSLLDLLLVLTFNYFQNLLESHKNGDQMLEIARQKVRKIECNAVNKASAFFRIFHPDRYERMLKKPDEYSYLCSVKQLIETVSKNDSHKLPANFQRQLFHFTIADVFTSHREHVHMLLCHCFLAEDPVHCESWLQLMLAIADSRLQTEDAQVRLTTEVKQWKRQYDPVERNRTTQKRRSEVDEYAEQGSSNVLSQLDRRNSSESHSGGGGGGGSNNSIQTVNRSSHALRSIGNSGALYVRVNGSDGNE